MRVVHLCDTPLSAAPYRLMKVQRIAGMSANLITGSPVMGHRTTWTDFVLGSDGIDTIRTLIGMANVIHLHNRFSKQRIFREHPDLLEIVRKKPLVLQFHSPRSQLMQDTPDSFDLKCRKLVVAQYQVRLYPEATPVPNAVPIDDVWHRPREGWLESSARPFIGFSPSSTIRAGWDNKGMQETLTAFQQLSKTAPHVQTRTFMNMSLEGCLLGRAKCDVVVDEVVTGSYHMVSLEALSQGQVAVAGLDEKTVDALEAVTGTREHPWVIASPRTLAKELYMLTSDAAALTERKRACRAYMERYWDPFRVSEIFHRIYKEL